MALTSRRNVDIVLNIVLKDLEDKLLFVWDQAECTDSGYYTLENSDKSLFLKNLSKVFQCFKGFSASNTIFVDDEPYKALRNPDNTGLFPLSYDPLNSMDKFLDPEGEFCFYLDGLAKSEDVQAYIKDHPFGQPKIDSSILIGLSTAKSRRLSLNLASLLLIFCILNNSLLLGVKL